MLNERQKSCNKKRGTSCKIIVLKSKKVLSFTVVKLNYWVDIKIVHMGITISLYYPSKNAKENCVIK